MTRINALSRLLFWLIFLVVALLPASLVAKTRPEGLVAVLNVGSSEKITSLIFFSDITRYKLFFFQAKEGQKELSLETFLEQVIYRKLLFHEATKFVTERPSQEAIDAKVQEIRERFEAGPAFEAALKEAGLSEEGLTRQVQDFLLVQALLNERIREFIFISPKVVSQDYARRAEEFSGETRKVAEAQIFEQLRKEKETKKISDYLERLLEKAKIEVLLKRPN